MNFYVLDRLMDLNVPELHEHFKEEKITPVFYSSGWFITLFTNTLQYTQESKLVIWMMDFYIAEGQKGFFKCLIALFKFLEPKFLRMSFDQIMNYLSDITRKEIFTNIEYAKYLEDKESGMDVEELRNKYVGFNQEFNFLDSFRKRVNSVKVTTALLVHLESKYKAVSSKLKNKL